VTNAFNGFAVATGEDFLAFLTAVAGSGKDAPKPTPLEKFLAAHPKAMKVVTAPKPVPASFATEPYFGVNAFEFTNAEASLASAATSSARRRARSSWAPRRPPRSRPTS
jgi:hypothetical protein